MDTYPRILQARDYTVAWISAIQKEYLIACAMLDEEHKTPIDVGNDYNCYTFGSVGDHNVVIASLPMARIGITQAGRLATEMVRTFPRLRFGLMVGNAGGAPTAKNDIRLGDVVVSTPNDHRRLGGVVNYGFGATYQGKGFERRGSLNSPPQVLLNAIQKLKTEHDRRGHNLLVLLNEVIEDNRPRLNAYRQPPIETDVLFESTCVHPQGKDSCLGICDLKESALVVRPTRPIELGGLGSPMVHYGTIGSADNLVRDALLRDRMAEEDGVLCFEMESAGIMNHDLRFMVIRGICNYSDSHKNDDWQCYAAGIAAVYTKQLLGVVRPNQISVESASSSLNITGLQITGSLEFEGMYDKRAASIPNASYNLDWIWQTNLSTWLSSSTGYFWISGKPGSGKSTMMSYLIDSKKTLEYLYLHNPNFWIVHFHFTSRADSKLPNSILGMYRMLLYQLADRSDVARMRLSELLRVGRLQVNSQQSLFDAVCEAVKACQKRLCFFMDGLDEFAGDLPEILQACRLMKDRITVKFCLASRPNDYIPRHLPVWSKLEMQGLNEASDKPLRRRAVPLPPMPALRIVRATHNLTAEAADKLTLSAGDTIEVLDDKSVDGWWTGRHNGRIGLVPSTYVKDVEPVGTFHNENDTEALPSRLQPQPFTPPTTSPAVRTGYQSNLVIPHN